MPRSPGYYGPPPPPEVVELLNKRAELARRGPCLVELDGQIMIDIPSPYLVHEFKAEMNRHNLKWNGVTWRRPTTPGKELAALRWARKLYRETWSYYDLPPLREVAGPLTDRVPPDSG